MNPNVLFLLYCLIAIPIFFSLNSFSAYSIGLFIGVSIIPIIFITIYNLKKGSTATRNISSIGIILWTLITVFAALNSWKTSSVVSHDFVSSMSDSQQADLYRNKEFTFSIKFPHGWNIRSGQTPHTVVVSENLKGESVIIQVWHLPKNISLEEFSEKDLQTYIEETFTELKNRYSNAILHDSGITYISDKKATWLVFTYTVKHASMTANVKTIMYQVFYGGHMYQIMCSGLVERFNQFENTFLNTVRSFIFEEASWDRK
jgi:hypothetical protein